MNRSNYRKSSGVILDVCREHGTWLDADELERIAGFILEGGETAPFFTQENESLASARAVAKRWARQADAVSGPAKSTSSGGVSLIELLSEILS
jgi:Zn-finger nucleic acid-binding protein